LAYIGGRFKFPLSLGGAVGCILQNIEESFTHDKVPERLIEVPERLIEVPERLIEVPERLIEVPERLIEVNRGYDKVNRGS